MQSVIDIGPIKLIVTGSCGSGQIASVHMADLIPVKFKLNFSTVDAQPLLNGILLLAIRGELATVVGLYAHVTFD